MDKLTAVRRAVADTAGERPAYFDDPDVDRVLAITMAVAGEVAVMGERLDTLERVLADKGVVLSAELEGYEPSDEVVRERLAWHEMFVARILRVVEQELEALKSRRAESTD
jgi:hypothetical protein